MTQRKHKSTIKCAGCGREFGIIQQAHIDRCDALQSMGVTTRRQYKEQFGSTMSCDAVTISINTIRNLNDGRTAEERSEHALNGYRAAVTKHPDLGRRGGLKGSIGLWKREGQKERHTERLIALNLKSLTQQGPNKLEQRFWDLIGQDKIEFVSFKFWKTIQTDRGFSHITPDFKVPGVMAVIEVFGDYWHAGDDPQVRISQWQSVGVECMVVWESQINRNPEIVKLMVSEYISRNLHERPTPQISVGGDIV